MVRKVERKIFPCEEKLKNADLANKFTRPWRHVPEEKKNEETKFWNTRKIKKIQKNCDRATSDLNNNEKTIAY